MGNPPLDETPWVEGVVGFATGNPVGPEHTVYGYPATTILLPAALLTNLGLEGFVALRITLAAGIAFICGGIAVLLYRVRLYPAWWGLASVPLLLTPRFISSTPPSALFAAFAAFFVFLVLEMRLREFSWKRYALMGLIGGLMLATRLETGVLFLGAAVLYVLWHTRTYVPAALVSGIALMAFLALDPYLWTAPVTHITAIVGKIAEHALRPPPTHDPFFLLTFYPLGIWALGLTAVLMFRVRLGLPRDFLVWLVATSACLIALLLSSHHHPEWFFFPVFLIWDILFPLLALKGFEYTRTRYEFSSLQLRLIAGIFVILFVLQWGYLYVRVLF